MNAGAYREPIIIKRANIVTDEVGNQSSKWIEYFKGYAYMNNLSGSEYWEAAQMNSQNTVMFIMRYHPLLSAMNTTEFRLLHRGNVYSITSIDNVQHKNETIKFRALIKE